MSTATTSPRAKLSIGAAVLVSFFDGQHNVHNQVAHVLSVGQIDEESDQPILSVAYPDPAASARTFTSAQWHDGYKRDTGVLHHTHPRVVAGLESITWGHPAPVDGFPTLIPQPEGNGARPYFEREVPQMPANPSIEQAAAVQSGTAPTPTTQSPLLNEPQEAATGASANSPETITSSAVDAQGAPDAPPVQVPPATGSEDAAAQQDASTEAVPEATHTS